MEKHYQYQCVIQIILPFFNSTSSNQESCRDSPSCDSSKTRSNVDRILVPPRQGRYREALHQVKGVGGVLLSHYLLATKRMARFCQIFILKRLIACLLMEKYRMKMLASILQDLRPGMWMVSLNLKDAHLHVPVSQSHRWFLRHGQRDSRYPLHIAVESSSIRVDYGLKALHQALGPSGSQLSFRTIVYVLVHRWHLPCPGRRSVGHTDQERLHLQLGFIINIAKSFLIAFKEMKVPG